MSVVNSSVVTAASGVIVYSPYPKAYGSASCVGENVVGQGDQFVQQTTQKGDSESAIEGPMNEFVEAMQPQVRSLLGTEEDPTRPFQRVSGASRFGTNPMSSSGFHAKIIEYVRTHSASSLNSDALPIGNINGVIDFLVKSWDGRFGERSRSSFDEYIIDFLSTHLRMDGNDKLYEELFSDEIAKDNSESRMALELMRQEFFPLFREQVLYDLRVASDKKESFISEETVVNAIYDIRLEETRNIAWMIVDSKRKIVERKKKNDLILQVGRQISGSERPHEVYTPITEQSTKGRDSLWTRIRNALRRRR